jgi:uncharacterized membrane protein
MKVDKMEETMLGPIQMMVVGFETNDKFKGDIQRELNELRTRGVIRLLDLLFVMKDEDGNVFAIEDSDLVPGEDAEVGQLISQMLGLGEGGGESAGADTNALTDTSQDYGLTTEDIVDVANQIEPGTSAGILLIEHVWAAGLKHAIREAGGHPIAQGFLTPEAFMMIGEEVKAIAEAEMAIEVADAVKGAALLDVLATIEIAEEVKEAAIEDAAETVADAELIKTIAVADAVRTLIVAGMIEDAAAQEAIDALVEADLIAAEALNEAEDVVAQAEAVVAAALEAGEDDESRDDGGSGVGIPA